MDSVDVKEYIVDLMIKVREVNPLIHCLTNYVTVNDCANILLALGASPTMTNYIEEVEDVVSKASALVINIGTLSKDMLNSMIVAGKKANELGVPIVLDPVGVGSSKFRKESAFKILNSINISVIRGNMAEIKTLSGMKSESKGVDSKEIHSEESERLVLELARSLDTVIAMTGDKDYISDGIDLFIISNGNKMMGRVTGSGCMTTATIGGYLGVTDNNLLAATSGVLTMGIAGDKALELLRTEEGSGSFRVKLIDSIYNMNSEDIVIRGRLNE